MKKIPKNLVFVLLVTAAALAGILVSDNKIFNSKSKISNLNQPLESTQITIQPNLSAPEDSSQEVQKNNTTQNTDNRSKQDEQANQDKQDKSSLSFPVDRFYERVSVNPFGNHLTLGQPSTEENTVTPSTCSKGKSYVGYHTASDLEVFADEIDKSVPVFSIGDGIVREASFVGGYGGLIVIDQSIQGKTQTVYYGHIDLAKTTVKKGDKVRPGEKITELAPECSSANGFTRKHLHFGIRKDDFLDVRGYVNDQNTLAQWVDPVKLFKQLKG